MDTKSDAILLSDLHLGSELCQVEPVLHFLNNLPPTLRLILVGDVLQSTEYRLKEKHWRVLSKLRQLGETMEVVWIKGNHDGDADHVAHLIGATFTDEYVLESGGRQLLCIHGHQWDLFVSSHPWLTKLAEWSYLRIQRLTQRPAVWRTLNGSTGKRCVDKVRQEAIKYGARRGVDVVVCGHVHFPEAPVLPEPGLPEYYNCGSWTDLQCHFVTIKDGQIQLQEFIDQPAMKNLATYFVSQARRVKRSLRSRTVVNHSWINQIFL